MRTTIWLDPKTKAKFDGLIEILELHAKRDVTQPEGLRFLMNIFTELEEATKLKLLEEI